ncbi:phosphotransferase family protein [Desmospora activa]|uniref:Aminoglycoside 2''-phosphotransferase n=1 Tax=Desmospora activa DSM 45169 TaxID=1121389 RepID=A0A2T4ZDD6_9BACL|nr:aminoglycoside phosphotransferase family protein [Desmospora activa]PTM59903.1 aminoglycoside 2''-phosphotransferase [Desmospora activa DSM 45169]
MDHKVLESIRRFYPDIPFSKVERLGSGQNNDVWVIDSTFIFRFPKYMEGIEQIKREAIFLNRIADLVPLQVPRPLYCGFDSGVVGHAFIGYRKIDGVPLEAEKLHRIKEVAILRQMAGQLGEFLQGLHRINPDEYSKGANAEYDPFLEWREMYERIQSKLYGFMKHEACQWTDRHFTEYLELDANARITPTLIHGDFGTENILYDPESNRVTGIIDFSSVQIGDPAIDYAALLASYGEGFFQMVMDHNPNIQGMMERVMFYKGTFALQEALFGLEHDDPKAFRAGMATVNELA